LTPHLFPISSYSTLMQNANEQSAETADSIVANEYPIQTQSGHNSQEGPKVYVFAYDVPWEQYQYV